MNGQFDKVISATHTALDSDLSADYLTHEVRVPIDLMHIASLSRAHAHIRVQSKLRCMHVCGCVQQCGRDLERSQSD
jgi:hypothetical protein